MSNAPRLSLPFDLGAGRQIDETTLKKLYDYVEKKFARGYYPIGHNTLWHGGVHIYGNEGEPIHAMWDGEIIAARLAPEPADEVFGSPNFILVKHTIRGAVLNMYGTNSGFNSREEFPFFSLYMHLGHQALEPGNVALLDVPWLAPQEAFSTTGSVGVGGVNKKPDVKTIQTMLNLLDYDAGVVDGLPGNRTYNAIKDFQKSFMSKPDGRIDANGRSWGTLLAAVAGANWPVDSGFDDALLAELGGGEVVYPNRRVCGGDKLWTLGPDGADEPNFLFQWEVFSKEPLFQGWNEVDGGETFTVDTRKMFELLGGPDWIDGGDAVITPKQITAFFKESDKAEKLRKAIVKFPSEWSLDPALMKAEFDDRFEDPGDEFEAEMAPYRWYTEDFIEASGAISAIHHHYNPITFMGALHEAVIASLPKIKPPTPPADDGPPAEPEEEPEPVVDGADCNVMFIPGHDAIIVIDDEQAEELEEQYAELDALIEKTLKANNQAEKDEAAALLRDKASVKQRADKKAGKKQKGGVAEVVVLTGKKPEKRYLPWDWIEFKMGAAGSEIEMHRKRGRGAAWISLDRPDLKDKSLKHRWGDWSDLEDDLTKWKSQKGQDGDDFLVDDDIDDDDPKDRAKAIARKVADSVKIWSKDWTKEGSIELAAGKVEVKTDTYDGSAEAAFMRLAGKANGKAEVSLTKVELSGKLEGSFNLAEAKLAVNSYTPDRDGVHLQIPKDISKGWKDKNNLVSIGRFRMKLSASLEGSVGATAMIGGAVSMGIGEDGEPMIAAGASLEAGAFAGARGAAKLEGGFEWQHPDFKHLSKSLQDQAKKNDNFFTLAKTGVQGDASVGIGAEATINFGYNEEKKCYEFRAKAGLTVGVGLGGELLFEVQVDKIWILCDIIYHALRQCDLKTLVFITVAAFYAIIYLSVAAVLYAVVHGVANLIMALGETLLEGGKALYESVFGSAALEKAEELANKLRKTAIANPGYFMTLLPDARGKILDLLCHSSVMSDEENIEDAVLFVLYPVTTRREYEKVLEGMYKCEKHKDDFANNRPITLKDRGKAQSDAESRLNALLDGNEQELFDEFVRDLASGAPKDTPRRPLDQDFVAKAMGLAVATAMAEELGVEFTGKSDNPADFRITENAKITKATWSVNEAYIHDRVSVTIETKDILPGAEVAVEQWDLDDFSDDFIQTNKGMIGQDGTCTLNFKASAFDNWETESEIYMKVRCAGLYRAFKGGGGRGAAGNAARRAAYLKLKVGEFTGAKWGKSSAAMWSKVPLTISHKGIPAGTDLEITFYDSDWGLLPDDKLQTMKVKAGSGDKTTVTVEITHHDGGSSDNYIYPSVKTLNYTTGETGGHKHEIKADLDDDLLTVKAPTVTNARWSKSTCERHDSVNVVFDHTGLKPGNEVEIDVYESDLINDDLLFTAKGKIGSGGHSSIPVSITKMDLGWTEGDNRVEFTLRTGTFEEEFHNKLTVKVPRITSGSWSKSQMALRQSVSITIHGKGFKDGTKAKITVWEDDVGIGGDDSLKVVNGAWKDDKIVVSLSITSSDGEWGEGDMECYFQVETDGFEKTFSDILIVAT